MDQLGQLVSSGLALLAPLRPTGLEILLGLGGLLAGGLLGLRLRPAPGSERIDTSTRPTTGAQTLQAPASRDRDPRA